jgi:NADH-quinone oxidoreductase subunit G
MPENVAPQEANQEHSIVLDGRTVPVEPGELVIAAAERAGVFIPRFCYHPRMEPVGMCRMCLVEISGPRGFSVQPSCFVQVADGMEVRTNSEAAKKAQEGVLEFLLVNHPLDCPVCDKGGECPLQDETLAYGPGESRFVEEKRHWPKPIPISPLIYLDRERCIQCARCTRFASEIAGDPDIDFFGRGDRIEVAIATERDFTSYFSGNIVQICPVGALTAKPYRFKARPWDLDQVESSCQTCALHCRMAVQASFDRVVRNLGIDSDPLNQGWLCDKGRFNFEGLVSDARVTAPLVRKEGEQVEVTWPEALERAAEGLRQALAKGGPSSIGFIGGAHMPNEDAYAWVKLAKGLIGTDNVDAQVGDGLPAQLLLGTKRATIDEACSASAVVVMAQDLREELPILWLRLRLAALKQGLKVIQLSPAPTSMDQWATHSVQYRPGELVSTVEGLVGQGPVAKVLSEAGGGTGQGIVVILGRANLAQDEMLEAAAALKLLKALPDAKVLPALRRGNVMGALDMGMSPGLAPGRVPLPIGSSQSQLGVLSAHWPVMPSREGLSTKGMLEAAGQGEITTLVLLGADPLFDFPDRQLARDALGCVENLICIDGFSNASNLQADVVLPSALWAERSGSATNIEGRVSRLAQKVTAPGMAWPEWMIAAELASAMELDLGASSIGELTDEIERVAPLYAGVTQGALDSPGARDGILVPLSASSSRVSIRRVLPVDPIALPGVESVEVQGAPARAGQVRATTAVSDTPKDASQPATVLLPDEFTVPHVEKLDQYSFRLLVSRKLFDKGSWVSNSPSLLSLIPRAVAMMAPSDVERLGLAKGQRVRIRSARGSIELEAVAVSGIPSQVVAVVMGAKQGDDLLELVDVARPVTDVVVETL